MLSNIKANNNKFFIRKFDIKIIIIKYVTQLIILSNLYIFLFLLFIKGLLIVSAGAYSIKQTKHIIGNIKQIKLGKINILQIYVIQIK